MVMSPFGLKKYELAFMPPEVGNGVTTVASAGKEPQGSVAVWAAFPLLFLPSFITYGWPKVDFPPIQGRAVVAADHHPKAGLLQDARVVVVGVSHCPATVVPLSVFIL